MAPEPRFDACMDLTLRKTLIGDETAPDDFVVIWDGIEIGRIFRQSGAPAHGGETWWWGITLHRPPLPAPIEGKCRDLNEAKHQFRDRWAAIMPLLSEDDIAAVRAWRR